MNLGHKCESRSWEDPASFCLDRAVPAKEQEEVGHGRRAHLEAVHPARGQRGRVASKECVESKERACERSDFALKMASCL